jgi:hypothetical protein
MHVVIAIVVAFIVGVGCGYGFRGLIHRDIGAAGQRAASAANAASTGIDKVAKKL